MKRVVIALHGVVVCTAALAQDPPSVTLQPVVVTSIVGPPKDRFELPASTTVVELDTSAAPSPNIGAALVGVPGLLARERQNPAQDTQLSIRGFGARSTFGVRGVRLYVDGVPATAPDGQGQLSHFALFGADRAEVLRGPFSALYGNSSGGVVQLFSADGGIPGARLQAVVGGDDSRQLAARLTGGGDSTGYAATLVRSETDGFRRHSAARRDSANLKWRVDFGERGTLTLVANRFDAPDAQDPLGLTRAEARVDPRAAAAAALLYDTRKSVLQQQVGAIADIALADGHGLRAVAYAGRREVEQFLSVPRAAQSSPSSAGGVVDLGGDYDGGDLRWLWAGELGGRAFDMAAGIAIDTQRQRRRGYENFLGDTLGVRGALRRDENNVARNIDAYLQGSWQLAPRWSLQAGARRSAVRYESDDRFVTAINPDDSGRADYAQTTPVAGLVFAPQRDSRVHLALGRGFETPTFNELSYRADTAPGLAFDLRPARSRNTELGYRWRGAGEARFEAALFRADTDDELGVARNVGGRASYRNVGRARREGLEFAAVVPLQTHWQWQFAYTRLAARFRDAFALCTASGCTTPDALVAAGARIPGTARDQLASRFVWNDHDWTAAAQLVAVSAVTVDDRGTQRAPGYGLVNLELGRRWRLRSGALSGALRVDNLFDRRYIGSVIVNESNGRYYEPGADRTASVSLRWDWND